MKKFKFINNYKYHGHWNKTFHLAITKDWAGIHILFGLFNFFVFTVI